MGDTHSAWRFVQPNKARSLGGVGPPQLPRGGSTAGARRAATLGAMDGADSRELARPADEVKGLMELLAEYIDFVTPELNEEGVRLRFIGDRRSPPLPPSLVEKMGWAEGLTARNDLITFYVPINYGGRDEILQAARRFADSTEEDFRALLYAPEMHDPELVIRPGGEKRLSNFLTWQVVDAWLVFSDEMWPEFSREAFEAAIGECREARTRRAPAVS